jgi:cyclopropane-fatty-acyl-phospholipid synthase
VSAGRPALEALLTRLVTRGKLTVRWPDGRSSVHEGEHPGPAAALALRGERTVRRLMLNPALAIGEAYMDGALAPVGCGIADVLDVLVLNAHGNERIHPPLWRRMALRKLLRRFEQINPAARARRNVAHHYDLNGRLYELFLDADRQYSCAYFPTGRETLDQAQAAKKRHVAAKLLLSRPGLRVLDVGSGWGGLALTLARDFGAHVTGITLSGEQLEAARARAAAAGLSDRVRFELRDYRAIDGVYDRIVSVGMFEHVGLNHYRSFFAAVRRALAPDGVALVHTIGRADGPGATNPWMAKYIFPGGYAPALSEVLPAVERARLTVADVETLRPHYADTLRLWAERFARNRDVIASLYDERFCRMFEFYFASCEIAFRRGGHTVFQLQIAPRGAAIPRTRDYISVAEQAAAEPVVRAAG